METQIISIDAKTDLVYSPDDNGWYFQRWLGGGQDQVSIVYPSQDAAMDAWRTNFVTRHPVQG